MKVFIHSYLKNSSGRVKRPELLSYLRVQMSDQQLTDRAMRKCIEDMVKTDGYLIQSSETGYTLIDSQEQMDEVIIYLDKKAASIAIRKNILIKNWREKQTLIELEKAKQQKPIFNQDLFSTQSQVHG